MKTLICILIAFVVIYHEASDARIFLNPEVFLMEQHQKLNKKFEKLEAESAVKRIEDEIIPYGKKISKYERKPIFKFLFRKTFVCSKNQSNSSFSLHGIEQSNVQEFQVP